MVKRPHLARIRSPPLPSRLAMLHRSVVSSHYRAPRIEVYRDQVYPTEEPEDHTADGAE